MTTYVTDDDMRAGLATTRTYTAVILVAGPNYGSPEAGPIIWEHGRRNFGLRADSVLNVVCPVTDDTDVCGIGIFDLDRDSTIALMDDDPGYGPASSRTTRIRSAASRATPSPSEASTSRSVGDRWRRHPAWTESRRGLEAWTQHELT